MRGEFDTLKNALDKFVKKRDWQRYHRPKNLAMSVAIEAAELMEHFQWCDREADSFSEEEKREIAEEMADVLHYLLRLASVLDIDLFEASLEKIAKNEKRFDPNRVKNMIKKGCEKGEKDV